MALNDTSINLLVASKKIFPIFGAYCATLVVSTYFTYVFQIYLDLGYEGVGYAQSLSFLFCFLILELIIRTTEEFDKNWTSFLSH